jgi:alpha-L-arabinofuranosidase
VHDEQSSTLTLFALNRSLGEEMPLQVTAAGFSGLALEQATQLHDADLQAVNSEADPERMRPSVLMGVRAHGNALYTVRNAAAGVLECNSDALLSPPQLRMRSPAGDENKRARRFGESPLARG